MSKKIDELIDRLIDKDNYIKIEEQIDKQIDLMFDT